MNRINRQRSTANNQNNMTIQNQEQNPFTQINLNNITPVRFMIKFNPPTISMLYKRHPKDSKKHAYNMELNNSAYNMDSNSITQQLFIEHPQYLKTKYFNQIQSLIQKLLIFKFYEQDFVNNEIDADIAQEKYDQMKENGFTHEDAVWFFAQFNIEIEPTDEEQQEETYQPMMTQSQLNQSSLNQSQFNQTQYMAQPQYNRPNSRFQQHKKQNQMNESNSNIQVQQYERQSSSSSKKRGKFDELRNLSKSRR